MTESIFLGFSIKKVGYISEITISDVNIHFYLFDINNHYLVFITNKFKTK